MDVLAKPAASLDLGSSRFSMQHLSNLLWAGSGAPRPSADASAPPVPVVRTADVYVLLKAGAFLYEPASHSLRPIVAQDIRGLVGLQDPRWRAPVTLVYVLDPTKGAPPGAAPRELSAAMTAGTMAQNVSLYCASEGLSASERPVTNPRVLGRRLRLRSDQRIVAAQVVGYPQR